ncbi:YCF48-related protein [Draconibacterium sp. IB214405]|uniref:T9SS type A sorting domain-containing protein n=1 Tax=Draconibacterium sp. IB214405 TaxID=3097352 RepID=UPI002A0B2674|nr:YCF48-related protein [Draconibacterium sp. IB214405]MDX8340001.1 YCF48-related protein [Draconibacterium sp. IB214405]
MKNFTLTLLICLMTIVASAQNPVFDWQATELSAGHNMKAMAIDGNNAVIAGYGNSLFKTTDGGESWFPLDILKPYFNLYDISIIGSVGYIVTSKEKLYDASPDVYLDGAIYKTIDGGLTWTSIAYPAFGTDEGPAINPTDTLSFGMDFTTVSVVNDSVAYCSAQWYEYLLDGTDSHAGIFKTVDGGQNWVNVSGDISTPVYSMDFYGEKGLMGGSKKLYSADASLDSIVDVFADLPGDGSAYIYDIDYVSETEILLTTTSDSMFISNDGGESFSTLGNLKGANDIQRINDSTIIVTAGKDNSFLSTNNGQSWNPLGISESIWEIGSIANDTIMLLAKAKIYKASISDLLAGTFEFITQEVGNANLQKSFASGDYVIIVGSDNNFLSSSDGGTTWDALPLPEMPAVNAFMEEVDFDGLAMNGAEGYISFNRIKYVDYDAKDDIYFSGGVFYTEDNWQTWKNLDMAKIGAENTDDVSINPNHANCNGVNPQIFTFDNDIILAYVKWYDYVDVKTDHARVFKTTDGGKNWLAITGDLGKKYVQDIKLNGDTLYIAGSSLFLKSTGTDVATATAPLDFTNLYPILDEGEDDAMFINAVLVDGDELFVVTSVDSCYRSNDGGMTFSTFSDSKGGNDIYQFDKNSYMILGGSGKSKFTNDTTTWIDCHPGATCFTIGGVLNGYIYGLARGSIYATSVEALDLKTAIPTLYTKTELNVAYTPTSIDLISTDGEIERCSMYSISGKLVLQAEPNNSVFRLNNNEFKSGIYIVNSFIEGKRYVNKIAFR